MTEIISFIDADFAVYDAVTGRIFRTGRCHPDDVPAQAISEGEAVFEGLVEHPTLFYFDGGVPTDRPSMPLAIDKTEIVADGVDAATISGIPNPSDIVVDGETVTVADGVLVLTADTGAVYELSCQQWPYLDWSVTITATPPGA